MKYTIVICLLTFILSGSYCRRSLSPPARQLINTIQQTPMDMTKMDSDLRFIAQSPHPLGSPRQEDIATYLKERLRQEQLTDIVVMPFSAATPNPAALTPEGAPVSPTIVKMGVNLAVRLPGSASATPRCAVLVASHYDTKVVDGMDYLGANDSGSSSVALLALLPMASVITRQLPTSCAIIGIWFDGEEATLTGWSTSEIDHPSHLVDHTYGSRAFAHNLTPCPELPKNICLPPSMGSLPIAGLILLDMVGSPQIQLTQDSNSNPDLVNLMKTADLMLYKDGTMIAQDVSPIEDDHIPFKELGIPVLNIIDFHHLTHWHAGGDTVDNISDESIEKATRLALAIALTLAGQGFNN